MQDLLEQWRASRPEVPQYNPAEQIDRPETALSKDALARAGGEVMPLTPHEWNGAVDGWPKIEHAGISRRLE